jgi:hypothetical protein
VGELPVFSVLLAVLLHAVVELRNLSFRLLLRLDLPLFLDLAPLAGQRLNALFCLLLEAVGLGRALVPSSAAVLHPRVPFGCEIVVLRPTGSGLGYGEGQFHDLFEGLTVGTVEKRVRGVGLLRVGLNCFGLPLLLLCLGQAVGETVSAVMAGLESDLFFLLAVDVADNVLELAKFVLEGEDVPFLFSDLAVLGFGLRGQCVDF